MMIQLILHGIGDYFLQTEIILYIYQMRICGIYQIVSPTGRTYIGQSVNIDKRKRNHKADSIKSKTKIGRSIKKHGWDSHAFNIIHVCAPSDLDALEIYYINLFDSMDSKKGLNLKHGGGGRIITEEMRKRLSKSHMGLNLSSESRKKLSDSHTGNTVHRLRSPEGDFHEFKNIRSFCRDQKLEHASIGMLIRRQIHFSQGWTREDSLSYAFVSPDGVVHENIYHLKTFADNLGLRMKGFSKLHCGAVKTYFKWKKYVRG